MRWDAKNVEKALHGYDMMMSRTAMESKVDTSVSGEKRVNTLTPDALAGILVRNRQLMAHAVAVFASQRPQHAFVPLAALLTLASAVNLGLTEGSILRTWSYEPVLRTETHELISPGEIPMELTRLAERVVLAYEARSSSGAIDCLIETEWDLTVGPLHPFYDGCGRVARAFSLLLSIWLDLCPVVYCNRREYMEAATEGLEVFKGFHKRLPHLELDRTTPFTTP